VAAADAGTMDAAKKYVVSSTLGLIDEYELVVHPRFAGHGPTLFAGLSKHVDLKLVSRQELGSGAVAMHYEPTR
jgi:dihydrofolate reductase